MSQHERTGKRCMVFSGWRRQQGKSLLDSRHTAIDVDFCEYCDIHRIPLALIECVRAWSADNLLETISGKSATITTKLAKQAGIDAFIVAYVPKSDDEIEYAMYRDLITLQTSEILDSSGLSRFIDLIHRSCRSCKEVEKNCGSEFTYWNEKV